MERLNITAPSRSRLRSALGAATVREWWYQVISCRRLVQDFRAAEADIVRRKARRDGRRFVDHAECQP